MSLCVLDHRDGKERNASRGYLCGGDYGRLERSVAEAPGLYDDLELALRRGSQGPRVGGRGGEEPTFIAGAVVECRLTMAQVLVGWTRIVVEERGLYTRPRSEEPSHTATFLLSHVDWLAEQPFIEEPYREITDVTRRGYALAYPSGRRRIVLGPCVEETIEGTCTGELSAVVRATDDLLPSEIRCDTEAEHVWTADAWLALGRRIHREVA